PQGVQLLEALGSPRVDHVPEPVQLQLLLASADAVRPRRRGATSPADPRDGRRADGSRLVDPRVAYPTSRATDVGHKARSEPVVIRRYRPMLLQLQWQPTVTQVDQACCNNRLNERKPKLPDKFAQFLNPVVSSFQWNRFSHAVPPAKCTNPSVFLIQKYF